jgi:hypothetical protein
VRKLPLIDRLRVGTACDVGWDNMDDLGRDRHCARCDLVVHDVSAMTRAEVEALLDERVRGQRVCLHRVVRESDGAVLVADGYIERTRRAPPSRMVAAAVATATAMTACSPASPPQAPQAEIAVAPMTAPASPIETTTPAPETPPAEPEPFSEPVTPVKLAPVKVAPPKPVNPVKPAKPLKPSKTQPQTVPPNHILIDGDVSW